MSDLDLTPGQDVTFTIARLPRREAERKTIQRLMRMQPHIQKGLKRLSRRRRQHDNRTYIRAGNEWTDRAKTTKLTWVEPGKSFTIQVTPQILPDLRSVAKYLKVA